MQAKVCDSRTLFFCYYGNMNYTLKLDEAQLLHLKNKLKKELITDDNPYLAFAAKVLDCRISAYKSGTVVFQGKDAEAIYSSLKSDYKPSVFTASCGSDEVGTGDYFGPIVVCACYIGEEGYRDVERFSIIDSKILSDERIQVLGKQLSSLLPYSLLVVNNEKYNEIQAYNNMNAIKAKLHNQAYLHLQKKLGKLPDLCVIDQFTPPANYFQYLKDEKTVFKDLVFATKAESQYIAVAAASIIARWAFLQHWDKMCREFRFNFPKGAGPAVDKALTLFRSTQAENLPKVAKLNFKNTSKNPLF